MRESMKCANCGFGDLRQQPEETSTTVGPLKFTAEIPALSCPKCGESMFPGPALEAFELQVADELGRMGQRTGEAFRFMRKAAGLRANVLAELLGVQPETVSRWETGKFEPDKAAFAALAALVHDRAQGRGDALQRLEALREGPRTGKRTIRLHQGEQDGREVVPSR